MTDIANGHDMEDGYRRGVRLVIHTKIYKSPFGELLIAEKDHGLIGLWIEGQKYYLSSIKEEMQETKESTVLNQAADWLDRYFAGEQPENSELPLAPGGSEFRKEIWQFLCEIPYGEVTTYGEISKAYAKRHGREHMSAQAIGGAIAHNPISIIIPCHRVIGTNGDLTGYAGGIDRKVWLLKHENYNGFADTVANVMCNRKKHDFSEN